MLKQLLDMEDFSGAIYLGPDTNTVIFSPLNEVPLALEKANVAKCRPMPPIRESSIRCLTCTQLTIPTILLHLKTPHPQLFREMESAIPPLQELQYEQFWRDAPADAAGTHSRNISC